MAVIFANLACFLVVVYWMTIHQRTTDVTTATAQTIAASMLALHVSLDMHRETGDHDHSEDVQDHSDLETDGNPINLREALRSLEEKKRRLQVLFSDDVPEGGGFTRLLYQLGFFEIPENVRAKWRHASLDRTLDVLIDAQLKSCKLICFAPDLTMAQRDAEIWHMRKMTSGVLLPGLAQLELAAQNWQSHALRTSYAMIAIAFVVTTLALAFVWFGIISPLIERVQKATRELGESNTLLERKVRDRTANLSVALKDSQSAVRAKSSFLANMSHEIRTPLNGVLGIAALMEQTDLSTEQAKYVGIIRQSGSLLKRVVDDVLDTAETNSSSQHLNLRPMKIEDPIREAMELLRPVATKNDQVLTLRTAGAPLGEALNDPDRLQQIANNLLSNAIKFSGPGDIIVTVTGMRRHGRELCKIEVADNGPGISIAQQEKIFEPFERGDAKNLVEGTGLGLALVRSIAERMGGRVELESAPGEGTIFRVTLPMHVSHALETSAA